MVSSRVLKSAVAVGGYDFLWYASPDLANTQGGHIALRSLAAAGLSVAVFDAALMHVKKVVENRDEFGNEEPEEPLSNAKAVVAVAGIAAVGAIAVGGEILTYRFGQRLKGRGWRFPHLMIGALSGIGTAILVAKELQSSKTTPAKVTVTYVQ